ncbi:MAG: hypothetical protein WDA23_03895 [Gemmobacter sp.]
MRTFLMAAALAAGAAAIVPGTVEARTIERACVQSDRAQGNRGLCNCIQRAADATLTRSDQRRAAGFFRNPHQAQEVRMSKTRADNDFWARYRNFGALAEQFCTR